MHPTEFSDLTNLGTSSPVNLHSQSQGPFEQGASPGTLLSAHAAEGSNGRRPAVVVGAEQWELVISATCAALFCSTSCYSFSMFLHRAVQEFVASCMNCFVVVWNQKHSTKSARCELKSPGHRVNLWKLVRRSCWWPGQNSSSWP